MSATRRSGASMAAKWPPRSNSDQWVTLCSRSAIRLTPGSPGKTATPWGSAEYSAAAPQLFRSSL